jgi:hypothetical protein
MLETILHGIQRLFPILQEEMGELSPLDQQFSQTLALMDLSPLTRRYEWVGNGCPPHSRLALARAFLAKSIYQFPTTYALIDALKCRPTLRRLCGWDYAGDIPSPATFSRAFAAFSEHRLADKIHEQMVETHASSKLVGHVSRDATAITAQETPLRKAKPARVAKKRGRPRKGEIRPVPPPKRLDLQPTRTLEENLADLPTVCDVGCKCNSKGNKEWWIGYKLHLDVIDGDIPVSAILTSASLNDSQVAIPLAQMTAQRVTSLYELMDSGYDTPHIHQFSRSLGHVAIIDPRRRSKQEKIQLDPASLQRLKERTAVERVNGLLKQRYGGRWVRVRGAAKVQCHLMFGLVALTAMALYARLC